MMTQCTRCGHEIDTDTAEGSEQGVTRGWDGEEDGYRDYHRLCRDLTIKERRDARRPGQPAQQESTRRKPGPKPKAKAGDEIGVKPAAVTDEMD